MRPYPVTLLAAAIAGLAAWPLAAQSSPDPANDRRGFYASGGLAYGLGSNGIVSTCPSTCSMPSGYLAIGGSLSESWRMGFEIDGWRQTGNGTSSQARFYSLAFALYPSESSNLWLKGNFGVGSSSVHQSGFTDSYEYLIYGVGAGYDWRLGSHGLAIIPFATYIKVVAAGSFLQIGLGFGYRH